MSVDPVCKMEVDEKTAEAKSDYKGKTYHFCAKGCKIAFDKEPQKYLKEEFMPKNVGGYDKVARIIVGVILLYFALTGHIWGWFGIIPILTAIIGYCPAYHILGISTCPLKK